MTEIRKHILNPGKKLAIWPLILTLFLILLAGPGPDAAVRHVPRYNTTLGFNGYKLPDRYTVEWIALHFYSSLAGRLDGPHPVAMALPDSVLAAAELLGLTFERGPYASSQEINLYNRDHPEYDKATRESDSAQNWLWDYSTHYLDSIGVPVESLFCQIADDMVAITQKGDGYRRILTAALTQAQKAWSYQYWNNDATDSYRYPNGYVNVVNMYNADARNAVAYAYRRHLIEDSAKVAPNGRMYTRYFMDNQYRDQADMHSYFTVDSTRGGPTAGLDIVQQPGITQPESMYVFFDKGYTRLDSTIKAVLDSTCGAHNLDTIRGVANVNKFYVQHIVPLMGKVHAITLENPIDYQKDYSKWNGWYVIADTLANHPDVEICWTLTGDLICSPTPTAWNYDSTRIYQMHFAFLLSVWNANTVWAPMRYNDSTRWRDIYECDFGLPTAKAVFIDTFGTGSTTNYIIRRYYVLAGDTTIVLLRTAHSTADYTNDSQLVSLGNDYYAVSANADTLATDTNQIYLKPYQGWIGVRNNTPSGTPTIDISPGFLNFVANVGAGNPGSKNLYITNTGSGTLAWTGSKDSTWLDYTPTSGGAPQTVTVSVDIVGKPAGTYEDTLVFTDAAATNNPQKIPVSVDLNAAPAGDNLGVKKTPGKGIKP